MLNFVSEHKWMHKLLSSKKYNHNINANTTTTAITTTTNITIIIIITSTNWGHVTAGIFLFVK